MYCRKAHAVTILQILYAYIDIAKYKSLSFKAGQAIGEVLAMGEP